MISSSSQQSFQSIQSLNYKKKSYVNQGNYDFLSNDKTNISQNIRNNKFLKYSNTSNSSKNSNNLNTSYSSYNSYNSKNLVEIKNVSKQIPQLESRKINSNINFLKKKTDSAKVEVIKEDDKDISQQSEFYPSMNDSSGYFDQFNKLNFENTLNAQVPSQSKKLKSKEKVNRDSTKENTKAMDLKEINDNILYSVSKGNMNSNKSDSSYKNHVSSYTDSTKKMNKNQIVKKKVRKTGNSVIFEDYSPFNEEIVLEDLNPNKMDTFEQLLEKSLLENKELCMKQNKEQSEKKTQQKPKKKSPNSTKKNPSKLSSKLQKFYKSNKQVNYNAPLNTSSHVKSYSNNETTLKSKICLKKTDSINDLKRKLSTRKLEFKTEKPQGNQFNKVNKPNKANGNAFTSHLNKSRFAKIDAKKKIYTNSNNNLTFKKVLTTTDNTHNTHNPNLPLTLRRNRSMIIKLPSRNLHDIQNSSGNMSNQNQVQNYKKSQRHISSFQIKLSDPKQGKTLNSNYSGVGKNNYKDSKLKQNAKPNQKSYKRIFSSFVQKKDSQKVGTMDNSSAIQLSSRYIKSVNKPKEPQSHRNGHYKPPLKTILSTKNLQPYVA